MPLTKVTIFLAMTTEQVSIEFGNQVAATPAQPFGWTENFYLNGDVVNTAIVHEACRTICRERANLMSSQGSVIGFRLQAVDPTGKSRSFDYFVRGTVDQECDSPEQCLTWNVRGDGVASRTKITVRGVPDARIRRGTYRRSDAYDESLKTFFKALKDRLFGFRAKDVSGETKRILSIDEGGVVVMKEDCGIVQGKEVQILRTVAAGDRQKGHVTTIKVRTDARHFTLEDWPYGFTAGGRMRLIKEVPYIWVAHDITTDEILSPRRGKRDTGGPTRKSRGRRSARH